MNFTIELWTYFNISSLSEVALVLHGGYYANYRVIHYLAPALLMAL